VAKWEDAVAVVGGLMKDVGMYPQRFLVKEFPTPEQLNRIKFEEVSKCALSSMMGSDLAEAPVVDAARSRTQANGRR
jgi:hypothetical protein